MPESGEPEEVGAAPDLGGPVAAAEEAKLPLPTRDSTPMELVKSYLQAGAAADWYPDLRKEERIPAAETHARKFLTQAAGEGWKPNASIDVIQVTSMTQQLDTVVATWRRVGVLDANGILTPAIGVSTETFEFKIAPLGDSGPRVLNNAPPNLLPLSLDGLQSLFEVRPVYYWEPNHRFLVPDRRYLSRGISAEKRVKAIVERVFGRPSEFLSRAVLDPPTQAPIGNAVPNGNNVVVDLPVSEQTDQEEELRRLASQIRWSLHPDRYSVELKVGGRRGRTYSDPDYLLDNPSQPRTQDRSNEQRLYAAVDGTVQPLSEATPPPILSRPENSNVIAAAVNTTGNSAALVRQLTNGEQQLWVGRAPADQSATWFRQVSFGRPIGTFSRPSYLPGATDRVLIVADGALYDVDLASGQAAAVERLNLGPLVAVSVAPDGARVALVTTSKVYVSTIDSEKSPATINTSTGTAPIRELYVGNLTELQGVGWSYEHQIVVGGTHGLMVAAIDGGALEQAGPDNLQGAQLTQLSAVPWDPIRNDGGNMVIEAKGSGNQRLAFRPYKAELEQLRAPARAGGPSSPAPSASGTTPPQPRVTAPFYADVR